MADEATTLSDDEIVTRAEAQALSDTGDDADTGDDSGDTGDAGDTSDTGDASDTGDDGGAAA